MVFHKEFRLLPCLLLLLFVAINLGNANQQRGSGMSMVLFKAGLKNGQITHNFNARDPHGECTRPGEFLSDTLNCSIFYVCESAGATPTGYTCPEGSLWNPDINTCDTSYDCPFAPVCANPGQVFPNEEDCSSLYFCSESGVPAELVPCPAGQFYNEATSICEDSANVDCNGRPGCLYPGQSFPNLNDCDTYFICNETLNPVKFLCPTNFSWDTVTHNCVLTAEATCATNKHIDTDKLTLMIKAGLKIKPYNPNKDTRQVREPDGTCTRPGEFLADTLNCSKFYVCKTDTDTAPTEYECPFPSLWNPEINTCDPDYECPYMPVCTNPAEVFPNNEDCASFYFCDNVGVPPTLYPCADGQFFNEATHICEGSSTVDCQGRPGCTYPGQSFPDIYDCTSYYVCDADMVPQKFTCPDNNYFDITINDCLETAEPNCATTPSPGSTTPPISSTGGNPCTSVGQTFGDPYDCSAYYQCDADLKPNHHFCSDGTLWDEESGLCQDEDTVTCNEITEPTIETTTGGSDTECTAPAQVIYSPTDCTTFFACDAALIARAHYCNPLSQLYYDPAYGNCNFANRVSCIDGVRPEPTPTAFPIAETPPPPGTVQCQQPGQFIPYALDCKDFYKCSANLTPERFSCPPNLLFHSATGCCDTVENAICGSV